LSRISLLRHGATAAAGRYCGSTDVPLNEEGWRQMWTAVAGRAWDRILCSPLERCAAFSAALAQRLAIPVMADPRLREMHFGDWEGQSPEEIMAYAPDALQRFWADPIGGRPPQAESLSDVASRVLAAWHEMLDGDSDERVLVVTHGGPIRILLLKLSGRPQAEILHLEVPHAALFDVSPLESIACFE
jgi:alpha-ribazole phosphatase